MKYAVLNKNGKEYFQLRTSEAFLYFKSIKVENELDL